jgi:transcription antitermination factor NusG
MPIFEPMASPSTLPAESAAVRADASWFAIQTRSRFEKKVARQLQEKGIDVFLPLVTERHKWSDRQATVHAPLFPHYLFVRIPECLTTRVSVLRTVGVEGFVGGRGAGTAIPDTEIDSISAVLSTGLPFAPYPFLNVGSRVRIRGGSLNGVEGVLVRKNDDLSLLLSVEIIQRSLAIQVTGYQIEPV